MYKNDGDRRELQVSLLFTRAPPQLLLTRVFALKPPRARYVLHVAVLSHFSFPHLLLSVFFSTTGASSHSSSSSEYSSSVQFSDSISSVSSMTSPVTSSGTVIHNFTYTACCSSIRFF